MDSCQVFQIDVISTRFFVSQISFDAESQLEYFWQLLPLIVIRLASNLYHVLT